MKYSTNWKIISISASLHYFLCLGSYIFIQAIQYLRIFMVRVHLEYNK